MLSSGLYIFASSNSQSEATTGRCPTGCLGATLRDWPYLDPELTVPDVVICIFDFTTPTHFRSGIHEICLHPRLIYTGASCNHIVYTAGTSSSVKVWYAGKFHYSIQHGFLLFYLWERHRLVFISRQRSTGLDIITSWCKFTNSAHIFIRKLKFEL